MQSCNQCENKGLISRLFSYLYTLLRKLWIFGSGRWDESRFWNDDLNGASKSAVQGSASGGLMSSKLWYLVLNIRPKALEEYSNGCQNSIPDRLRQGSVFKCALQLRHLREGYGGCDAGRRRNKARTT